MATVAEIETRVLRYVIDAPQMVIDDVPTIVQDVILQAQQDFNWQAMEALWSPLTTAGSASLGPLPANWKAFRLKPWYDSDLGGHYELTISPDPLQVNRAYGADDTGAPALLWIENGNAYTAPLPDGASDWTDGEYRLRVPYWAYLPAVTGAQTNWITENLSRWVLYQSVASAFMMDWNEERGRQWEAVALREWLRVTKIEKINRLGGIDELVPHSGARAPQLTR